MRMIAHSCVKKKRIFVRVTELRTHTHMRACSPRTHSRTHSWTQAQNISHPHSCTQTSIHAYTHARKQSFTHTLMHANWKHAHTHAHPRTFALKHAQMARANYHIIRVSKKRGLVLGKNLSFIDIRGNCFFNAGTVSSKTDIVVAGPGTN